MPLTDFRYVMRFRVPYCDVDMLQHVNHAAYVVWVETIRCNYFTEVLQGADQREQRNDPGATAI